MHVLFGPLAVESDSTGNGGLLFASTIARLLPVGTKKSPLIRAGLMTSLRDVKGPIQRHSSGYAGRAHARQRTIGVLMWVAENHLPCVISPAAK
jgi:hypothetical protein